MKLENHIINNSDKSEINQKIISIVEELKHTDSDLIHAINTQLENISNDTESIKSRIKESKFSNDEINEKFNIYKTSNNFDLFQENSIIRDGFITIAGFSSSGKTSFATQMGLDILSHNDNTVLIVYSMDDSKSFIKKKMYKQLLDKNIDISNISPLGNEILEYKKHIDKNIIDRIHIFESLNLFSEINSIDIYRDLKAISNYHSNIENLKLIVIIDYLQVLEHDNQNIREGLNKACKELKNIQKHFNCMIIALSQLSNEGNYRETSEIKNISDIIIKQYSEKEYIEKVLKRNSPPNTSMNFIFTLEKNKAGIKGITYKAVINSNFSFSGFKTYDTKQFNPNIERPSIENTNRIKYDSLGNRSKKIYSDKFYETDKFIVYNNLEYSQSDHYIESAYKTKVSKNKLYFIATKGYLETNKSYKKIWTDTHER